MTLDEIIGLRDRVRNRKLDTDEAELVRTEALAANGRRRVLDLLLAGAR